MRWHSDVMLGNNAQSRIMLPQVTLCAATSVNVQATVLALQACMVRMDFAACKLFTDAPISADIPGIMTIPIPPMANSAQYSDFLLSRMVDHVDTSHALIVQWDGHVLDAARWDPAFLEYDYIGASWPQFTDDHDVGNGGFSLRSHRLMTACRLPHFQPVHPEDVAVARVNRAWLEAAGMRFAPRTIADGFSAERAGNPLASFGYHGVWHMPRVLGPEQFWRIYRTLDERTSIGHDFLPVLKQVAQGKGGAARALRLLVDRVIDMAR